MGAMFERLVRVRWSDSDVLGHVNHAVFPDLSRGGQGRVLPAGPGRIRTTWWSGSRWTCARRSGTGISRRACRGSAAGRHQPTTRELILTAAGEVAAEARVVTGALGSGRAPAGAVQRGRARATRSQPWPATAARATVACCHGARQTRPDRPAGLQALPGDDDVRIANDESTAVAILDRAAEGGIDFLDTSDAYPLGGDLSTRGITEEILGRWLRGKRDRFIVATKCFARTGPAPFDGGNSRKHIMAAVDASLRRLQTDYIDLYQLHNYDPETPIDETLGALDDLVRAGKVRYTGLLELPHLPPGAGGRPQRDARAGPAGLRPAPVQPALPADRAGDAPRSAGKRASASSPTTRSPAGADRQDSRIRAARRRDLLHPRHGGRNVPEPVLGTSASSTPSTTCSSWPRRPGPAWSPFPSPGCWPTRPSRRRSSGPA